MLFRSERQTGTFVFHPGPIFTQVLLADEINRATPKTQSGLLEAMEERQVTSDGATRALPSPFFVIATQNPAHQVGTFPLPESQLDRFLMCLSLGYPDAAAERALLVLDDGHPNLCGVAITKNGVGRARVAPSLVTCRSSIASSRPDWVFGVARLISSASSTCVKIGPG